MITQYDKYRLFIISRKVARLSIEFKRASTEFCKILEDDGYLLIHDAGIGFEDESWFPDWFVEKMDYGMGNITEDDIEQLLSELKKK